MRHFQQTDIPETVNKISLQIQNGRGLQIVRYSAVESNVVIFIIALRSWKRHQVSNDFFSEVEPINWWNEDCLSCKYIYIIFIHKISIDNDEAIIK